MDKFNISAPSIDGINPIIPNQKLIELGYGNNNIITLRITKYMGKTHILGYITYKYTAYFQTFSNKEKRVKEATFSNNR